MSSANTKTPQFSVFCHAPKVKSTFLLLTLFGTSAAFLWVAALSNWRYWTTWSLALNVFASIALFLFEGIREFVSNSQYTGVLVTLARFSDACLVNAIGVALTIVYVLEKNLDDNSDDFSWADRCDYYFSAHFAIHFFPLVTFLIYRRSTRSCHMLKISKHSHYTFAFLSSCQLIYTSIVDVGKTYSLASSEEVRTTFAVYSGAVAFICFFL